jgi:hypothetical protein
MRNNRLYMYGSMQLIPPLEKLHADLIKYEAAEDYEACAEIRELIILKDIHGELNGLNMDHIYYENET